jgi:hypothetical protein
MSDTTIAQHVFEYIYFDIMCGQGGGLARTTPLLELGILDSFALLKLVAHLNGAYGLEIKPDEIVGEDFRNLDAIVAFVTRRLGARAAPEAEHDDVAVEGPAVFEAPDCAQLFVLFTGLGHFLWNGRRVVHWPVSRFFTESGLTDRNVIVFGDPYGQSYRAGVSDALSSPRKIFEWIGRWTAARPHVEEIYCLGMSAGGPIAMTAGEHLNARTVWAFAPRPVRTELAGTMPRLMVRLLKDVTGKPMARLKSGLTDEDCRKIDAVCTPELVERYYRSFYDPQTVIDMAHLAELIDVLAHASGATEHRLFYCVWDRCDAFVVDRLRAYPAVTVTHVPPSEADPKPWLFSKWLPPEEWMMRNHTVADLLLERGQLNALFPPFRAAATACRRHDEAAARA